MDADAAAVPRQRSKVPTHRRRWRALPGATRGPQERRRGLRLRRRMRHRLLPGGRLLQRQHLRQARPGGALPAGRPVRQRTMLRRRLLQRRLQRQLRELQPARPHGRVHARARRPEGPARGLPGRAGRDLRLQRLLQRPGRLRQVRARHRLRRRGLLGPAHLHPRGRVRRRGRLREGAAARVHPLHLRGRQLPVELRGGRRLRAPQRLHRRPLRPARQGTDLHRGRAVPERLLRRRRLLRERLRRPLPVLRLARQPRHLRARARGRARSARRRGRHRPRPGLRGPGGGHLRDQRPLRRAGRLPALRERGHLPGRPLRERAQPGDRRLGLHGRQLPGARGRELRPLPRLHRQPLHHPVRERQPVRPGLLLHRRQLRQAAHRRRVQPRHRLHLHPLRPGALLRPRLRRHLPGLQPRRLARGPARPCAAGTEDGDCGDPRCSACDGMGQCARTAGAVCQNSCASGNMAIQVHTCNAEGACVPGEPVACFTGARCRMGMCGCIGMQIDCVGECVDTRSDIRHCGGCSQLCGEDRSARAAPASARPTSPSAERSAATAPAPSASAPPPCRRSCHRFCPDRPPIDRHHFAGVPAPERGLVPHGRTSVTAGTSIRRPDFVAPRLNTSSIRSRRALPGRRLDVPTATDLLP